MAYKTPIILSGTKHAPLTTPDMLDPSALPANKYRFVQNLVAGNNVITHSLALANTAVLVDVRNNSTGATIAHRVIAETATTTTIWVAAAVTGARITIMG